MTILTLKELAIAIVKQLGIDAEEAKRYAHIIIDFFGYDDRIIDNILNQEERQLFYRLQEHGLLSSQREEATISNGNPWRIHYWVLERSFIHRIAHTALPTLKPVKQQGKEQANQTQYEQLYNEVPTSLWSTRKLVSRKDMHP